MHDGDNLHEVIDQTIDQQIIESADSVLEDRRLNLRPSFGGFGYAKAAVDDRVEESLPKMRTALDEEIKSVLQLHGGVSGESAFHVLIFA